MSADFIDKHMSAERPLPAAEGNEMGEDVGRKFEAAWEVFSRTCAGSVAPEATFQAWFAHYLISQFGIDRVAREPIFKHKEFESNPWSTLLRGGEVKLDAVVTRVPGVYLPHYASVPEPSIKRIGDLAVISELKVSATQKGGLDHTEVCRDIWKLSMLLEEAEVKKRPRPLAYACILDNHPDRSYNRVHLERRLAKAGQHAGVRVLFASAPTTVAGSTWAD